ncbi:unnamed protein product [Ilex paraguariensis]|uniref:Squalene monooxygenase n=1 Tax=Ilex paraguariensis TaxID=185542 RepID=A0ABC8SG07_9AQUA
MTSPIEEEGTVKGVKYKTASGQDLKEFAPLRIMPCELYSTFMSAIDEGNIRSMPNRSMLAAAHPTPGALLLGDAFNTRHPLIGGGMTIALSDNVVLRDLLRNLRNLNNAYALCKYLESIYTLRKVSSIIVY